MEKLLRTSEFAARVGIRPATARAWRVFGKGPRHIKNGRLTFYRESDVDEWIRGLSSYGSTAEFIAKEKGR